MERLVSAHHKRAIDREKEVKEGKGREERTKVEKLEQGSASVLMNI